MTAAVVPFPITRRHGFIDRQADHAAMMNPESGINYLNYQIRLQAEAMRRKGIEESLVQRELQCMRTALQARCARFIEHPER